MTRLANVVTGAFALGILSIASSPAISQSVPFSWTGAYIGGNAGATFHPGSSAFSGGGQIGYSYQVNPTWVLGVEADLQTANIRKQTSSGQAFPTSVSGAPFVCQLGNPALGTVPARSFDLTDPNNGFAGLVQFVTGSRTISTPQQCAAVFNNPTFRATLTGAFGAIAPAVTITNSPTAVLARPDYQQVNTAAGLGDIFAKQRADKLDLSGVAAIDPQLSLLPQIESNGLMRMAGFFPSVPQQVNFELLFTPVDGQWRLFGLSVNLGQAAPAAPMPASPPPAPAKQSEKKAPAPAPAKQSAPPPKQ